jgi:hypothetical protein
MQHKQQPASWSKVPKGTKQGAGRPTRQLQLQHLLVTQWWNLRVPRRPSKSARQKQGWQQAHAFRSAAGSSDGIAEGRMSVAEEEMVKHALTQMECP